MSFILDALKKSEAERRQGEVPSLKNDLGSAAPRRRSIWPLLLILALLLNGGVLGGWLLLRQEKPAMAEAPSGEPGRTLATRPVLPLPAKDPVPRPAPRSVEAQPAVPVAAAEPLTESPVESVPPAVAPPAEFPSIPPVAQSKEESGAPVSIPLETPAAPAELSASLEPEPPGQVQAAAQKFPSTAAAAPAGAAPATTESFPLFSELPSDVRSGLPEMNLQLHFYSMEPARRLVRLNGFNLREGEKGGDGLNVVEITPDGIRLACRGIRFFFPAARR
jgi:general secretion pathway protein B